MSLSDHDHYSVYDVASSWRSSAELFDSRELLCLRMPVVDL